jgi:hypothetical protein
MAFATAAALHERGTFVFGDDALHLEQQLILGGRADRAIEKDNRYPCVGQFFHEQHLVGIPTRQAVRGTDRESIDAAQRGEIPQALQAGTNQGRAALPIVDKRALGRKVQTILTGPFVQGGHLAFDRLGRGLALRGDARVECGVRPVHRGACRSRAARAIRCPRGSDSGRCGGGGTTCAYARARCSCANRSTSNIATTGRSIALCACIVGPSWENAIRTPHAPEMEHQRRRGVLPLHTQPRSRDRGLPF